MCAAKIQLGSLQQLAQTSSVSGTKAQSKEAVAEPVGQTNEPVNKLAQPVGNQSELSGQGHSSQESQNEEPLYEVHYVDQDGKEFIRLEKNPPKEGEMTNEQIQEIINKEKKERAEKEKVQQELQRLKEEKRKAEEDAKKAALGKDEKLKKALLEKAKEANLKASQAALKMKEKEANLKKLEGLLAKADKIRKVEE